MILSLPKRDLLGALSTVIGASDKRAVIPSLACVRIEAKADGVILQATDLKVAQSCTIAIAPERPGSIALNAQALHERVKAMPDGPITLTTVDGSTTLKAQGSARKYVLRGMPAADFPPVPRLDESAPTTTLSAATLAKLIGAVHNAISTDETRPHLNAMLLEWEGTTVRAVSTDGHRLHLAEVKVDGEGSMSMLIPLSGVNLVRKLCEAGDTLVIAQHGASAFFRSGTAELSVKLVDATFPPYRQVIPKHHVHEVKVLARTLRDTVRAVAVSASATGGVKFAFDKGSSVALTSESPDAGQSEDAVQTDSEWTGAPLTIGFNGKYVEAACEASGDESITLGLNGELDPMLITSSSGTFVLMPLRC